jgi:hypothetical protein
MILIFLSPLYCTCPQNGQEISSSLGTLIAIHNIVLYLISLKKNEGMMMKWTVVVLLASLFICGSSFGATLNLRATWTANTETDMRDYRLYRTDGTRTLIGTIPHPNTSYNFSVTVPDLSSGTLRFVLTAVDTNNNESLDGSPASYSYNFDTIPPAAPRNLSVQMQ